MERFAFPSTSAQHSSSGNATTPTINPLEDPFSIELDRLDVLDLVDNNNFMNEVIDFKKCLLEDAKLMRKAFELDQITSFDEQNLKPKKIKKKAHSGSLKKKRYNIDDDDEMNEESITNKDDQTGDLEINQNDEEASDEEEEEAQMSDELEEDNDYTDAHFDNGEDFID